MTTARARQLCGRGHRLRRIVVIVLALVVIGIVADRAITSFWPRSWSGGTLTGTLEAVGGPAGTGPRARHGRMSGEVVAGLETGTTARVR